MLRINDILDKAQGYLTSEELEMIQKAYIYSATVHQGQVRLSGEPYLTHPMEVAGILVDMKMDSRRSSAACCTTRLKTRLPRASRSNRNSARMSLFSSAD